MSETDLYKTVVMMKADNILNNAKLTEDDRIWLDAMLNMGLDAMKERDDLQWEKENKIK